MFFRKSIWEQKRRFIKYCLVGLTGVIVNEFFLFFFTEFVGLFYLISSLIAIEISVITNFLLNDNWTFQDRKKSKYRFFRFNFVSIVGIVINMCILFFFTSFLSIYYLISNLFGIAGATLWNYVINFKWTWKR